MKKAILVIMVILMMAETAMAEPHVLDSDALSHYYPHMAVVTKVKRVKTESYYKVSATDVNGRVWKWYSSDNKYWHKGDFAALLMYDMNTKKVKDDQILDARRVGNRKSFK